MATNRKTTCKKCGSTQVGWVQSKRTGKWYLAFATEYRASTTYLPDSAHTTPGGVQVHPQTPHKCDDYTRGGMMDRRHPAYAAGGRPYPFDN